MWETYVFDSMTGGIVAPIDIPNLSWTLTVSSCSLTTTRDKGTGEGDATGLTVPWGALPVSSQAARNEFIAPYRRGVVLMWDGAPVVAGFIGMRKDSYADTSFDLISPMDLLGSRYVVREGTFGRDHGSTTSDAMRFSGMSLRAIACEIGLLATEEKQGGHLPIDWQYQGETGSSERTYHGYNVANGSAKKLLTEISNVDGGPDMQFRPYMSDNRLRWSFEAGSDSDPYLGQSGVIPTLTWFEGGGTIERVQVAHGAPVMRVYGTGSGQDEGTLCCEAADMTLCRRRDPFPVIETTVGSSDWDNAALVASHARAVLESSKRPRVQVTGQVFAGDSGNPVVPGLVWPGQRVDVAIDGYPTLPDDVYGLRLMEMSGDLTDRVKLTFDPFDDPWEEY
jgi:hypothetical protein